MKPRCKVIVALALITLIISACMGATDEPDNNGDEMLNQQQNNNTGVGSVPVSIDEVEYDDPEQPGEVSGEIIRLGQYTPPGPPITFTCFVANEGRPPGPNNKIVKMIEEFTGVTMEFDFLVGDFEQLIGVMLASETYPDIINPVNARSRFIEAGAFIPLDGIIGKYPNIAKHYAPYIQKIRNVAPDGKAYILDTWDRFYWYGEYSDYLDDFNSQAFWIQKEVLADADYVVPKNLNEYFDVLEAYYRKNPQINGMDTLPFEFYAASGSIWGLANPPQHMVGGGNDGDAFVKTEALLGNELFDHLALYEAEIYHNKWYAKMYYAKLNEVFKKGLIAPDVFTQTRDQYMQKIAHGRVLSMFDAQWNFQDAERVMITDGNYGRTYVPLGLVYDGYEPAYMDEPKFIGGNGIGITVNCKDIDRFLTYVDTLLNEDIQRLLSWGIDGEDYYTTEDGRYLLTPKQLADASNPEWRIQHSGKHLRDQLPKIQGMFSDGNAHAYGNQPEIRMSSRNEYDNEFYSHFDWTMKSGFLRSTEKADYYPVWSYTMPRGSEARSAFVDIQDAAVRYLPGVVMADDFEKAWAEYTAVYDSINYRAYEEELNRQIADRMGISR